MHPALIAYGNKFVENHHYDSERQAGKQKGTASR